MVVQAMKYDLVCEGGGIRGIGLVGAMEGIEQRGFLPSHLAGTSAGSIVASLRATGYTPLQLRDILLDTDFSKFKDGNGWGRKLYNILRYRGIYHGDYFYEYIREFLAAKGVVYFGDLKSANVSDCDHFIYRWIFKCFVADVTRKRLVTFPDDAKLYGLDPDYMEVALAVRASMSIPVIFQPVMMKQSILVDGGILSNYPINSWDSTVPPEWPTFGILLDEDSRKRQFEPIGRYPHDYFIALFDTMLKAHDKLNIKPGDFKYRTIRVPCGTVDGTDFDLSLSEKKFLYNNGIHAAREFLNEWSWADYQRWAKEVRGLA
jgi:NTE family protein